MPLRKIPKNFTDQTCQYFGSDGLQCFLHESPLFGNWMNVITAVLIAIGIIFEAILLCMIGDLLLYGDEPEDVYRYDSKAPGIAGVFSHETSFLGRLR